MVEKERVIIPKTYMTSIGMEAELPTAVAVEYLLKEGPISSGFHGALNQRWTVIFLGKVSRKAAGAAKKAGLEVKERIAGAGMLLTDVSLPDVAEAECDKATKAFDKFAELYTGEKMPQREVVCKVEKVEG